MSSSNFLITRIVGLLCLFFLFSCQDTIPQRSTIAPGSTVNTTPTCPEGQELVTENQDGTLNQYCKDKAITRPDGAVFWKTDFCACKDGKPVTFGNCSSFCSDKNTSGAERLYANFRVTEAISLGGFGNIGGWCKAVLPGDTQNPECELQAKDDKGNILRLSVTIPTGTNSITANIQDLGFDKTYVLTLVERTSGVKSDSIQIIKYSPNTNIALLGPLKNVPISQYSCLIREYSEDEIGDIFYDYAYRQHFYFIPRLPPRPIPAGQSLYICHDIFNPAYGTIDQELFPRFEQLAGVFNLWDNTDPRFYDNNGNGTIDVNEIIVQKTKLFGGSIPSSTNFFQIFSWFDAPEIIDENNKPGDYKAKELGYFMAPWIDQTTFRSYCLNSSHYNSTNPLFQAMRDVIGVDTEGLYIGEKSPEAVTKNDGSTGTGSPDYIMIREEDLKAVWFYLKDGVPTTPTDITVANNAIFFYYPINKASPYVRTSTQRIYRIRSASELNKMPKDTTPGGPLPSYPPHDKKIGCIPKF